ncbi:putative ankyrin repeat-containing protein [Aspergillus sclerotioniger CBS 115572]|uniref:Putative ankyrin repeat-containing protein n=1 Tax=Aspergillus sclerotioniger CBS 115572 TaxID=1450535 RepID=A0A317XDB4_9EURO|nr:putative ankyrin repeat-containing protein [Aspergillus sclerotioniger CBS 115572]PWY94530.1 putative ankyrin repeat-containing protein [Aspergillus sclerotioniger CBS 115572]
MEDDFVLVDRPNPQSFPELSSWLQPTAYHDPASDFHKHVGAHVPGTGDWIEKTPQYERWHGTDSEAILWIRAIAGAGKSVLIASRIARLQQYEPQAPILFFFRQIVTACHGSHALVRDWLDQLLPHSPSLQKALGACKKQGSIVTEYSFAELWQILTDALLAMPTRIQTALGGILSVRLEDRLVNRDIACFMRFQLDLAKDSIQSAIRNEIIRSMEDRVFPSFLYARLMLNEVLEEAQRASLNIQAVQRLIQSIHATLEDLYSQMLNDHSRRAGVPRERQMFILQLVTHATRPLRLLEIATVWKFLDVSITHHSFTEFLTDTNRADRISMHENTFPVIDMVETNQIVLACVRYLLSGGLTTWKRQTVSRLVRDPWKDMQRAQLNFPFIEYAACNWFIHVSRLPEIKSDLMNLLNAFTRLENPSYLAYVEMVMKVERESATISPQHVSAWGHMTAYAKALIQHAERGCDVNALDGQKMTPLSRAAAKGFPDMVSLLLENGATPNPEPDHRGRRPLHYAAQMNHHGVVRLLLEAGADPVVHRSTKYDPPQCSTYMPGRNFGSPLEYACEAGAVHSVRAMLPYLAAHDLKSALQWSIDAHQLEMVEMLVDLPELDMTRDNFIQDCLTSATQAHDPAVLQVLIDLSARLNHHTPTNPKDKEKCLDIILRTGCDVNARSKIGRTALHACVAAQASTIVEKLLKHGADVHVIDENGSTPLHLLDPRDRTYDGSVARILHAMTRAGASWDVMNGNGDRVPLLVWCQKYDFDEINFDLLQPYVTDWNITDEEGNTPFHLLLKRRPTKNTLQKLVGMGADLNRHNNEGCTPLLCTHNIDQLLDLGADIHAIDNEGNGVLHLFCEHHRCLGDLHVLLSAGADPLHLNHNGDTVWHVLMRHTLHHSFNALVSMVYMLRRLAGGIHLSRRNHDGQTLLHCMCGAEASNAQILLDPSKSPIDHLPAIEVKAMLEVEDHQGRRPIHLAAANSEVLVDWLIRRENVLHIAAAARDSNTLGLLLESYLDDEPLQEAINEANQDGRTPLISPSAMLLLEAGADVSRTDKKSRTSLHACAEFKRHPSTSDSRQAEQRRTVKNEDDTLGVTGIIRALLAHGADPLARDSMGRSPLEFAVDLENDEMVMELADLTPRHPQAEAKQLSLTPRDEYIHTLIDKATETAAKAASASPREIIVECEHLLKQGAFRVLELMVGRGLEVSRKQVFSKNRIRREDFIQSLARWGFSHLFETLGKSRDETDWIDGAMSRPFEINFDLPPLIFTASERELPNLNMLQVIIEAFHADVNIRAYENVRAPLLGRYINDEPHRSALHILAVGNHWWQTDAIRYLLQRGTDVTMRNAKGQTPLHIAVRGGYRRLGLAAVLLEDGADPNALHKTGVMSLAFAVGNSEMVQLLLNHGGKFELGSRPVLFEAISQQDIETVRIVLESGCNWGQTPFKQSLAELDKFEKRMFARHFGGEFEDRRIQEAEEIRDREQRLLLCQPVHYAAHGRFNQVAERAKAVEIVELLLAHGADPFCLSGEGITTIHGVFNQGGIVEPFLARLTEADLERRDCHGRTLLLATCEVGSRQDKFQSQKAHAFDNLEPHPTASMQKAHAIFRLCEMGADLSATDEKGNNVLHLLVAPEQHGIPSAAQILPMMISKCPRNLIHQTNQQRNTPLHVAARGHQWKAVRLLLDAGADPVVADSDGNTLLHHLAGCLREVNASDRQMTRSPQRPPPEDLWVDFSRLLGRGLDINARDNNGDTPLFKYVRSLSSQPSLRGPLLDRFLAAGSGSFCVAKVGVPHSLIPSPPDKKFVDAFTYLMELGLDPFDEDDKQRTPVDIAAAFGKEDILALFKK